MPAVIETTELISKTMDELIDFVATDEFLSKDFEEHLIKNKIEITKDSELNDVLIDYILDGKTLDGIRVLDYFKEKNQNQDLKTIEALKNSFVSVFKINKISKNSLETTDLISEKDFSLIPLVKTTHLRGLGLFDFIKARAINLDMTYYILEILDVISQYKEHIANIEVVKSIIKNPKIAVIHNREKFIEIKKQISSFHSSFLEVFENNEIIVSNKDADSLLNDFYSYHRGFIDSVQYKKLDDSFDFKYFNQEYNSDFMLNAVSGFNSSDVEYDIGFYSDSISGLFIVPYLGTLNKILKTNSIENEDNISCIRYFLINDGVSANLLRKKQEEYKSFIEIINKVTGKNFETIEDVIDVFKYEYKDETRLSSLNVLYSSSAFSKVLGKKEENEIKAVGRNDLCPCGSGKKYKKCCLNKGV